MKLLKKEWVRFSSKEGLGAHWKLMLSCAYLMLTGRGGLLLRLEELRCLRSLECPAR